ncbi:MAG: hypothetical protein RR321_04090 [Acidaminococcaceae bacterium]
MEENVYDLVADFYAHDEGWNMVLRQDYAEGFLRQAAWQGADDAELRKKWQYMMMFCLYLGHAENMFGDLDEDDIIDGIAWCGRNIADFAISFGVVQEYLTLLNALLLYLKGKKAISSAVAAQIAAKTLLGEDGVLHTIKADGEFTPTEARRALYATPNAPVKIFLNIGDMLQDLLDELHDYFQADEFHVDLERAIFLYQGIFSEEKPEDLETDEFWQCFWDYFLFDYHLLQDDQTPLVHFQATKLSANQELLLELRNSKLALFTIDGVNEDDMYICTDFLTQESYNLNLPLEGELDTQEMIFIGHIFYNNTMVMNYIRCLRIGKLASNRLRQVLRACYEWFLIQEPNGTWQDFVARHPMAVRHMTYLYSVSLKLGGFEQHTEVQNYTPPVVVEPADAVTLCLEKILSSYHFAQRDIMLATRMWLDFAQEEGTSFQKPEQWAAGVITNYVRLNAVYSYSDQRLAEMCWQVPLVTLRLTADKIKQKLKIEKHDPRYCNEESFLMMLFSS